MSIYTPPTRDIARLLQSARSGSTAAPLELFIHIREAIQSLTHNAPLIAPDVPVRSRIENAYLHLVPSEARTPDIHATFLSIGAAAMRDLLTQEAATNLDRATVHRSVPSFRTIERLLHAGASLEPRHWSTLLAIDEALTRLGRTRRTVAEVLEGRFFGQMQEDELARMLKQPTRRVQDYLTTGTSWLYRYEAADRPSVGRRKRPSPQRP